MNKLARTLGIKPNICFNAESVSYAPGGQRFQRNLLFLFAPRVETTLML